jgi:hypothetical protein
MLQTLFEFFFGSVMPNAIWTIGPITTSLLVSAGASGLGFAADQIFNDQDLPDVPDLSSEVRGQYETAQRQLEDQTDQNIDKVQSDASAAGMNPVSAMAEVIDSNNDAMADLQAKERDAVARAENKEEQLRYKQKLGETRRRRQNISQGIGSIVNSVSQAGTSYALGQMGDDSGGGGDPNPFGGFNIPGVGGPPLPS